MRSHHAKRDAFRYGLMIALFALLGLTLLYPIVLVVFRGFIDEVDGGFTLRYFFGDGVGVLRDPLYRQGLWNALGVALCTTFLCLVISLPMAVLAARYRFPGKAAITSLVLVPLILPPFVGAIGLAALLGRFGASNTVLMRIGILDPEGPGIDFLGGGLGGRFWAVVVMEALHLYPIIYLNLTAALANLDPSLDEAAENLGASRVKRFFRVTLPLILPGIFAGSTIVLIWSFTELGTPLMFEYRTITPVQVFYGLQEIESNPRPYALVVVMLLAAIALYSVGKLALGGKAYAMQSKATAAVSERRLTGWRGIAALAFFVVVTGAAVLPHIGVIFSSLAVQGSWYRSILPAELTGGHFSAALTHDLAMQSVLNSLGYATAAMLLCAVLGLAIAYLTVRCKLRGSGALDTLGMLPLAVPGLVMAFGYVAMSIQFSGAFRDAGFDRIADLLSVRGQNPNPVLFLVLAYTVRRLPYILRAAAAGLQQTSGDLEEAAWNLGATPATTVRRIVVPLILANLIAGSILVFSFAMLEVSDSLILAEKEPHYPITKAIWALYSRLGDGPAIASAMGVWGMALLTITMVGASVLMGKKLGSIFRV